MPGLVVGSSSSGATLFYRAHLRLQAAGRNFALKAAESAEEDRILYALTSLVDDCRAPILQNIEAMEALDFIFAKGNSAQRWAQSVPGSTWNNVFPSSRGDTRC